MSCKGKNPLGTRPIRTTFKANVANKVTIIRTGWFERQSQGTAIAGEQQVKAVFKGAVDAVVLFSRHAA